MITLEGLDPCLFCESPKEECKNCEDKSIFMLDTKEEPTEEKGA